LSYQLTGQRRLPHMSHVESGQQIPAKDVTQENIQTTIYVKGFTNPPRRPSTSDTNDLKINGFADYGLSDHTLGHCEEDHLISLELGDDPRDPHNLWPEPYTVSIPDGGAHKRDSVEGYLNGQVCHGKMTLKEAQKEIVDLQGQVLKDAEVESLSDSLFVRSTVISAAHMPSDFYTKVACLYAQPPHGR
jgi:hypothetical protein